MSLESRPEGTLLAGKFRVLRELGRGAMGVVYEVRHELTKHRRALKTLDAEVMAEPDAADRFMREASAAGRIDNVHIVETFDAGLLETGEPFLVMELLSGETLADRLEREGPFPLEDLRVLFAQACEGIQAAHDAGIVHRDLKPENLFITRAGDRPFMKILDFGISKFTSVLGNSTQTGTTIGTPGYMSPEQVRGQQSLDGRSDIYSLGVILFECATGEHPYPAETPTAMIANVLEVEPHAVSAHRSDAPAELDRVVARALCKDREDRYPSARELGAALHSALEGAGDGERPRESEAKSALPRMPTGAVASPPVRASARKAAPLQRIVITALVTFSLVAAVLWVSGMLRPDSSGEQGPERDAMPPRGEGNVDIVPSPLPAATSSPSLASSAAPDESASASPANPPSSAGSAIRSPAAPPAPSVASPPTKPPAAEGDDLATKGEFKP